MKYLIVTEGTWGDVLPFLYIGRELKNKGKNVTVFTNEYYKNKVLEFGLEFIQTTNLGTRTRLLSNENLWKPFKGLRFLSESVAEIFEKSYPIVMDNLDADDVVISHAFSFAGKVAADVKKAKQISVLISPIQARTKYDLPVVLNGINPNKWPSFIKKYFYEFGDLLILNRLTPRSIKSVLKDKKILAEKSFMDYGVSKYLSIGLWPEWYSPIYKDQKHYLELAGFPSNVVIEEIEDDELSHWISIGSAPIVVTLGSGYYFNETLVEMVKEISSETNERFIVIAQEENFEDSDSIIFRRRINLTNVLCRSKIFIHHGGAGSCAQAINSGVPSIVLPMSHDQPDNAQKIFKNNLGVFINRKNLNKKNLKNEIEKVLRSNTIKQAVIEAKLKCQNIDAIKNAAEIILEN